MAVPHLVERVRVSGVLRARASVFRFLDPLCKPKPPKPHFHVDLTPSAFATLRRALGYFAPAFGQADPADPSERGQLALKIKALVVTLQVCRPVA